MKDFEKLSKQTIGKNNIILEKFESSLKKQGLTQKTIYNHLNNISFYVNDFLINQMTFEDDKDNLIMPDAIDGVEIELVDEFLGNFFIRKCMWSTESTIKSNITSFKKFYTFLEKEGLIDKFELKDMKEGIKELKDDWIRKVNLYNDPNIDFDDIMEEFF